MTKFDDCWKLLDGLETWEDVCLGAGMVMLSFAARETTQGILPNLAVDLAVTTLIRTSEKNGASKDLVNAYLSGQRNELDTLGGH